MNPQIEDIRDNKVAEANFLSYQFTLEEAQQYAKALADNTSVVKLEFVSCSISDKIFTELAKGILQRKKSFIHINLDMNYLSEASFPLLREIIKQKKCQHLMFFGNLSLVDYYTRLDSHEEQMKELQAIADTPNSKVYLHYDNPKIRSYKGFFETLRDKRLKQMGIPQEETKEQANSHRNGY